MVDREPVERSRAGPGEIADSPESGDIKSIEVEDREGDPTGFLLKWAGDGQWMYAGKQSYVELY